jgi:RNA polymerase sigma factor (sigma-70 family)
LFRFAYGMVKDEEAARDIVHDVMEQMWMSVDTLLEEKNQLTAFARRLVYNKSIDFFRRKSVRDGYAYLQLKVSSESYLSEPDAHEERIQMLMKALDDLPPLTRRILTECYFNGHKRRETAQLLGISESTVKKHIMNAFRYFRQKISKNGE